jgi:hypothetical protein
LAELHEASRAGASTGVAMAVLFSVVLVSFLVAAVLLAGYFGML